MLVSMVSLGCAKNMVDAEMALAKLLGEGFDLAVDPSDADVVLVNSCGFIQSARDEADDVVREMLALKKKSGNRIKVAIMGCLSERFPEEMSAKHPQLDAVWGLEIYDTLGSAVRNLVDSSVRGILGIGKPSRPYEGARLLSTPQSYAYLKISDGCDNHCAYCAIPGIRGGFRSREPHAIVDEAKTLEDQGVQEIIVISQDTTCYGRDLAGGATIESLMEALLRAVSVPRLRLLYAHPAHIGCGLVDMLLAEQRLCRYLDIPFQHVSDNMLTAMGRGYGKDRVYEILDRFKGKDFTVRTTLMTGFPGETEEDFRELLSLAESGMIQQMGVFSWSPEIGTRASTFPGRLFDGIGESRREILLAAQQKSAFNWLDSRVRGTERLLVDQVAGDGWFEARSIHEAPDADGIIFVKGRGCKPGGFVNACIVGREGYDLLAETVQKDGGNAAGKKRRVQGKKRKS
jgi:ribosomal protein S12 methylthiotransferase RimO